ncbi:hypothetical protein Tco_0724129 [Tanacetum coccineum]
MECLPKRRWSTLEKKRANILIKAIDKQLKERRLMRSLEKFVGGRHYGTNLRLLQRTMRLCLIVVAIIRRFFVLQAGNPVKENLLKLNLPDHRSILTDWKASIQEREKHKQEYDRRMNDRMMQSKEGNVDSSKALNAGLVITENSETESDRHVSSSRSRKDRHAEEADINSGNDKQPIVEKCVFSANHDACITKLLKEVNSRAKVQSPKTRNSNKLVKPKIHTQKPGRQIVIRHRFSPNKSSAVHEKTNTPRSCLRWIPTGRIFNTVGLSTSFQSLKRKDLEFVLKKLMSKKSSASGDTQTKQSPNSSQVQEAAASRAKVLADSLVSTSIEQDAPSSSIPSSKEHEHSPIISQAVLTFVSTAGAIGNTTKTKSAGY